MKKLFVLFLALFIFHLFTYSQGCLPEGITFSTQEQIDDFQTNYPGCTEIEGNVEIGGFGITNLSGLNVLTSIGGTLLKGSCYNLSNLNGLHNLYSVGGDFNIKSMSNLTNFEGLNNLFSVGGDFYLEGYNFDLINFEGLGNLYSVGGDFIIEENYDIINFEGLNNLSDIGGDFTIEDNYHLVNFEGLESLSSISGNLKIEHNSTLSSLSGLGNINPASIHQINITRNNSLSACNIESICQYLSSPNGTVTIYNNDDGCNSPGQIADNCGITLPCLPYGDYYFFNQSEIDNFQTNYPGCTEIEGDVEISGDNITNLNGLNVLTAIAGELIIEDNSSLVDLNGFNVLLTIGGDLYIKDNASLVNLTGLNNLTSIGNSLRIINNENLTNLWALSNLTSFVGFLNIYNNNALADLSGLEGITVVYQLNISNNASLLSLAGLDNITSGGYIFSIRSNNALSSIANLGNLQSLEWLYITDNPALTSLSGLDNLSFAYALSISENDALTSLSGLENVETESLCILSVFDNSTLSDCDIQSICDYLLSSNGMINIHDNSLGCNSQTEVEEACLTNTDEYENTGNDIQIFPNPAKSTITILNSSNAKIKEVNIYNQTGQITLHKEAPINVIDISFLQQGMYIIELITNESKIRKKLIID